MQHTGASTFLPDASGLFRFRTIDDAVRYIEHIQANYEQECDAARALCDTYFDAKKVAARVLEIALA